MNLQGNPLDYLIAFFAGVLTSLTPCVYPLIPITLSFIGVNPAAKKSTAFSLSLIYVTGIALVYVALGLIAALSGSVFGMITTHPLTRVIVGFILIIFGLSFFDVLTIKTLRLQHKFLLNHQGKGKVFFMGLTSGLLISPCVSPVLGSILILVASRKSIIYGATLLLTFAYGMGLILILCGTFSNILLALPKSGSWMNMIKKVGGLILIGMGVHFIFLGIRGG